MKTLSAKPAEVQHDWYVVDASGKTLGRLATEIARRLRGKHKTSYTPHVDTGDYIVVINAEEIQVTGKKALDKKYYRHTGFPGGIRETNFEKLIAHKPEAVLEKAVKGMLPKGPLWLCNDQENESVCRYRASTRCSTATSFGHLRDTAHGY